MIFLSICKCDLANIMIKLIIDYRLKCQFEQLIFFRTSKFFDWSVTDKEELRLWIFRHMEIYTIFIGYTIAPKLFEKLNKVEKWNQKNFTEENIPKNTCQEKSLNQN